MTEEVKRKARRIWTTKESRRKEGRGSDESEEKE